MRGAASAGGEFIGDHGEGGPGGDHVIGVAAVEREAGDLRAVLAGEEIAAAAVVAGVAMPGVPADADAQAGGPARGDARADGVDDADDFVAGDAGVFDAGHEALFDEGVAVADAAGLDFDADLVGAGRGDGAGDEFEGTVFAGDLDGAHGGHGNSFRGWLFHTRRAGRTGVGRFRLPHKRGR